MGTWNALKNEWTALVTEYPDGIPADALERLVQRWDGWMEDTGGGVIVGFVELRTRAGIVVIGSATITNESIQLWSGREPFSDDEGDVVIYSEDVVR